MQPLITIIIPVYNGEKYIKECIESVTAQSLQKLQIIVVDDGSTDASGAICDEFAAKDSRIEVIHQKNTGVSVARNVGLKVVRAKWVLFVDADDTIAPEYCYSMLEGAESIDADVLIARPKTEGQPEIQLSLEREKLMQACLAFDEISFSFNIDAPWGKLFRYSVIHKHNIIFPENLTRSEDAYFCLCFYQMAATIGILNWFGYRHIERECSLCRSYAPDGPVTLERVLTKNYRWIEKYHATEMDYLRALWYRVLPGIVECERVFFLHPDFRGTRFQIIKEYQKCLNQKMVQKAIWNLRLADVKSKQYRIRLVLYKLHMGWLFILLKR